jgi:hypothetical protein
MAMPPRLRTFVDYVNGRPEVVCHYVLYPFILSIAAFATQACFDTGVITAFFAMNLFASAASLTHWRTERGLWMLALLFFLIYVFTYACCVLGTIRDAIRGIQVDDTPLFIDFTIGFLLLSITLRFLATVAKENYATTTNPNLESPYQISED